jgi:hypothetical protein
LQRLDSTRTLESLDIKTSSGIKDNNFVSQQHGNRDKWIDMVYGNDNKMICCPFKRLGNSERTKSKQTSLKHSSHENKKVNENLK